MKRKKILFLINNLLGGGAEKILIETIKKIDKSKYDIDLMTIYDDGIYIDEAKKLVNYKTMFKKHKKFWGISFYSFVLRYLKIMPATFLYRKYIRKKYDVEIAFLEGAPTKIISGSNNYKSRKICWVHVDPVAQKLSTKNYISFRSEKKAYMKFDKIFCVSSQVQRSFNERYEITDNVEVLLNILDEDIIIKKSQEELKDCDFLNSSFKIVSTGRLARQKNFMMLLKVINRLKKDFDFCLYIFGEGKCRNELEKYIEENELQNYVKLKGFVNNPFPYIKNGDLYVCSSIAEGFSTAVTEALILGVPVITTLCAGMDDLLGNSEYGLITANNEDSLYDGFYKLLSDKNLYNNYKNRAKERGKMFSSNERIKEFNTKVFGENIC